jgi:hypothetical protein
VLQSGAVVEKYEVIRPLGEGGMAMVYLVRHRTLQTLHALKVLTVTGKSLRERLVEEGRVQARLLHPNVVRVVDVVDVDGQPGLVMDYVDGPDLHDWIVEHQPDPAQAEALFRGIVAGVKAAHDQGLIHRDLKPANVLVATQPDGTLVPKVADFGLSKAVHGDAPGKGRTRSGMPMGTPAYMAPEQIRDAAHVDARADIFSLGCILHELVAHSTAFDGDDAITIFNAVLADQRTPLPAARPGVPKHLADTVDACLVADRDQRLASCDELLEVLAGRRTWPVPLPVAVPPPPPAATVLLGSGLAVAGLMGLASLGLVGGAMLWWLWPQGGDEPVWCSTSAGSRGWVRHPGLIPPGTGRTWRVPRETTVHDQPPGEPHHEVVSCLLPAGAELVVGERQGSWLEVMGEQLTLPEVEGPIEEEEPAAEPDDEQPLPCAGHEGLVGWANPRPFAPKQGTLWVVRARQSVFADRPSESNGWSTAHDVVCTLPPGTRLQVDEAPVKVRGTGQWVPVYAEALQR